MSSLNKAILIGRVGQDPELKYMPNGDAVVNISLATSEQYKDKNTGEKKETTEWHRLTMFRKLAEIAGQYVTKGALLYVEGRIQSRKWTDKDGVERTTVEIVVDQMKMLGARTDGEPRLPGGSRPRNHVPASKSPNVGGGDMMDDDIPFANPYRGKRGLAV